PEPDAVAILVDFMASRPRCGVAGPRMLYPDGSWQPSRRSFPTVGATLVRRTPLRLLFRPTRWQRKHYLLDERPEEPAETDTMLGAFLLLRRAMLDDVGGFDPGFRMYCEDIDLNYRAAKAGWERWYVPAAVVRHEYAAVDASEEMVRAARARGARVELADLNDYAPPEPVAATTCFRAIYYARDRRAFFRQVAAYTEKKLVFDLNPRQYELREVCDD